MVSVTTLPPKRERWRDPELVSYDKSVVAPNNAGPGFAGRYFTDPYGGARLYADLEIGGGLSKEMLVAATKNDRILIFGSKRVEHPVHIGLTHAATEKEDPMIPDRLGILGHGDFRMVLCIGRRCHGKSRSRKQQAFHGKNFLSIRLSAEISYLFNLPF